MAWISAAVCLPKCFACRKEAEIQLLIIIGDPLADAIVFDE